MEVEGSLFKKQFLIIKDTLYYDNFPTALCSQERIRIDESVDTKLIDEIAATITTTVQQVAKAISDISAAPTRGLGEGVFRAGEVLGRISPQKHGGKSNR